MILLDGILNFNLLDGIASQFCSFFNSKNEENERQRTTCARNGKFKSFM